MIFFTGKRFLFLLMIVISIPFVMIGISRILVWQTINIPTLSINDVRHPELVPPYQRKEILGRDLTVHGKLWTSVYHDTNYGPTNYNTKMPIDQNFRVKIGETLTLPNGHWLRIEPLKVLPLLSLESSTKIASFGEMYVDKEGGWVGPEKAKKLQEKIKYSAITPQVLPRGDEAQYEATLIITHNIDYPNFKFGDLIDAKTGWKASGNHLGRSRGEIVYAEDRKTILNMTDIFSMPINYVRPSPLAFYVDVSTGEEQSMKFTLTKGEQHRWNDHTCELLEVGDGTWTKTTTGQSTIFVTELKFNGVPTAGRKLIVYDQSGKKIEDLSLAYTGSADQISVSIPLPKSEIGHLEIRYKPELNRIFINLPDLPITPLLIGDADHLMEMKFPQNTIVNSDQELSELYSSVVQANYYNPTPYFYNGSLHSHPSQYPYDFSGWTVQELLTWEASHFPPHEYAFIDNGNIVSINRQAPATSIRFNGSTFEKWLVNWKLKRESLGLTIGVIAILLLKLTLLLRAKSLSNFLRTRGYTAFTIWDFEYLVAALGRKAWHLPARDEIGIIPGVDPDQPKQLAAFMKNQNHTI